VLASVRILIEKARAERMPDIIIPVDALESLVELASRTVH
jgi:hypothetical protein